MERSKFAGGDQAYLRDEQYRDSSRLGRRADLHARYSTATEPWFDFVVDRIALAAHSDVLDAGCGPAWLWELNHREIPPGRTTRASSATPRAGSRRWYSMWLATARSNRSTGLAGAIRRARGSCTPSVRGGRRGR